MVRDDAARVELRPMTRADLPAVLDAQEAGGVLGLAEVFPQDRFPFPRDAVRRRWEDELEDDAVACLVVVEGGSVVGFAATRGGEVLHFGTAPQRWGSGVAVAAHDLLLHRMRAAGVSTAWLTVYAANGRGRRFWSRLGWQATGETSRGPLPPHAELLRYERSLSD